MFAQALATTTRDTSTYSGAPGFAYQIGTWARLDKDWQLHLADPTQDQLDAIETVAQDLGVTVEHPSEGETYGLRVSIPTTGWTPGTRANLEAMLTSKGALIARALNIPATPVKFTGEEVCFPWFESLPAPEVIDAVTHLVAAMYQTAKDSTRISAKPPAGGNDKYALLAAAPRIHRRGHQAVSPYSARQPGRGRDLAQPERRGDTAVNAKPGQRVRLIHTSDPYTRLSPGEEGTIADVDDLGTVHIHWDCGSRLGLIPGVDEWENLP